MSNLSSVKTLLALTVSGNTGFGRLRFYDVQCISEQSLSASPDCVYVCDSSSRSTHGYRRSLLNVQSWRSVVSTRQAAAVAIPSSQDGE